MAGRHGELVPDCSQALHDGIRGSELVVFENSSHLPHLEEPERYFAVVGDVLARVDGR